MQILTGHFIGHTLKFVSGTPFWAVAVCHRWSGFVSFVPCVGGVIHGICQSRFRPQSGSNQAPTFTSRCFGNKFVAIKCRVLNSIMKILTFVQARTSHNEAQQRSSSHGTKNQWAISNAKSARNFNLISNNKFLCYLTAPMSHHGKTTWVLSVELLLLLGCTSWRPARFIRSADGIWVTVPYSTETIPPLVLARILKLYAVDGWTSSMKMTGMFWISSETVV